MLGDHLQAVENAFHALSVPQAPLERLFTGCRWAEGPVWFADQGCLLFSDIPNDRMLRWTEDGGISLFRQPAGHTNGHARDLEGRLVSCEHGNRRVTRTEPDGAITVLADNYGGRRLNSPNDIVVKSDGSIWFTDPDYGILSDYEGHAGTSELGACLVFRIDPSGTLDVVADDFARPNGLAFSPDERRLYVADSGFSHDPEGPHHVRVFEVGDGGRLRGGEVFCEISPGVPDGLRTDEAGHLWVAAHDGVQCWSPEGRLLGRILVPEAVANLRFGGPRRNQLFMTATTSLYRTFVATRGAQRP